MPIIKTTVREVLVPVVVTDPKGHHISNLKRSDFKVFEDGIPEDIVAFSATTDSAAPDLSQTAAASRRQPFQASAIHGYVFIRSRAHLSDRRRHASLVPSKL